MQIGRREFIATGLAAGMMAPYALAAVKKSALGAKKMELVNGEDEEEMYKEMYLAMITGVSSFGDTLVDDISTSVRASAFWNFPNTIKKLVFNKATSFGIGAFRQMPYIEEVELPLATALKSNALTSCTNLQTVRAPKCANFGNNAFQSSANVKDIYITELDKSEVIGFPWAITSAATVFHFKDGNYDYQGNPVNA